MRDNKFGSFFLKKKKILLLLRREREVVNDGRGPLIVRGGFSFSLVATGVTPSCWPRGPRIVWSSQRNARAKNYKRTHLLKKEEDEKKTRVKVFLGAKEKKKKEFFLDETGTLHLKASSFISTRHAQKSRATFVFWGFSHFFFCSSSSSFLKNSRPGVASGTPPMRQKFVLMIFFVSSQLSRRSSSTNEPSVN